MMPPLTSKDSTAPLIINLVEQLKDLDAKEINEVAKALSMAKKKKKTRPRDDDEAITGIKKTKSVKRMKLESK